jgi:hypothetical protein
MVKSSTQQVEIIILSICMSNIRAPKYVKQTLIDIRGELGSITMVIGNFNTPFHQETDHSYKINEETIELS